jgi:hypothetical protein
MFLVEIWLVRVLICADLLQVLDNKLRQWEFQLNQEPLEGSLVVESSAAKPSAKFVVQCY